MKDGKTRQKKKNKMFNYFRELLYTLKLLHGEVKELKMLLIMFIGANGLSQIQDIPKPPTDDEIRKDGGFIVNPSNTKIQPTNESTDFFSYHGPLPTQTEDELLDAELPSSK